MISSAVYFSAGCNLRLVTKPTKDLAGIQNAIRCWSQHWQLMTQLVFGGLLAFGCFMLVGCGAGAPAIVHATNLLPQVASLGGNIHTARVLNRKAQTLADKLSTAVSPRAIAPLHGVLQHQQRILVRAGVDVVLLAQQAAENQRALATMEKTTRNAQANMATAQARAQSFAQQRDAARQRYERAWLGGKTHRLIAWVLGLGLLLVVGDFLISAIFGVGFNPLEWIFSLVRVAHVRV